MLFSFSSSVDSGSNISDDPHDGIINRIIDNNIALELLTLLGHEVKHKKLIFV